MSDCIPLLMFGMFLLLFIFLLYDVDCFFVFFEMFITSLQSSKKKRKKLIKLLLNVCRDKSNTPSGFTLKLRKHIRTRRLEDVRQLGYDRVCFFSFYFALISGFLFWFLSFLSNFYKLLWTDNPFPIWIRC